MPVTNVEKFKLSYIYRGHNVVANCERFVIDGKIQLWIPVVDKSGYIKYANVIWENSAQGERFFRYPLPEPKETRMHAILIALEEQLPPFAW